MQKGTITWDELKNQYYHNLQSLQTSMDVTHSSSIELYRIYTEVMNKAKNTSPETIKRFTDSWLKKLKEEGVTSVPGLKEQYNNLVKNPNPTEDDLNEFERQLQNILKDRALVLLASYHLVMQGFYDTWMEMWSK